MSPRPQSHRAAGAARRALLLDAAIDVIAEGGVKAATHRAIAARAGVPLSSTSYFFTSIDELIAAAMDVAATRLIGNIRQLALEPTSRESAPQVIDRYLDLLIGDAAQTGATGAEKLSQLTLYLQCRHDPALRPIAQRLITTYEEVTESLLESLGVPDAHFRARVIMAFIDGAALQNAVWSRGIEDLDFFRRAIKALINSTPEQD
ncbi:TetR/AcrR family transcriptional regulator [Nocardia sp. NPDC056100]|uniref:TetR/AcrR family transcriptional regulator n=1 Tax=Nocardia sp. NPDC056100 TaxID=3345712 RepID=UPI0035D7B18F